MGAIHIRKRLDSHVVDLPELKPLVGQTVEITVIPQADDHSPPAEGPKPGTAKGMIWMADDFDAPLEDFKEYME